MIFIELDCGGFLFGKLYVFVTFWYFILSIYYSYQKKIEKLKCINQKTNLYILFGKYDYCFRCFSLFNYVLSLLVGNKYVIEHWFCKQHQAYDWSVLCNFFLRYLKLTFSESSAFSNPILALIQLTYSASISFIKFLKSIKGFRDMFQN